MKSKIEFTIGILYVRLEPSYQPEGKLLKRINAPGDLPYLNIEIRLGPARLLLGHIDFV